MLDPSVVSQAFTVWAAIVGLVGAAIVYELARLRGELKQMSAQMNVYIVGMERRVSSIETHLRLREGFQPSQDRDDN